MPAELNALVAPGQTVLPYSSFVAAAAPRVPPSEQAGDDGGMHNRVGGGGAWLNAEAPRAPGGTAGEGIGRFGVVPSDAAPPADARAAAFVARREQLGSLGDGEMHSRIGGGGVEGAVGAQVYSRSRRRHIPHSNGEATRALVRGVGAPAGGETHFGNTGAGGESHFASAAAAGGARTMPCRRQYKGSLASSGTAAALAPAEDGGMHIRVGGGGDAVAPASGGAAASAPGAAADAAPRALRFDEPRVLHLRATPLGNA